VNINSLLYKSIQLPEVSRRARLLPFASISVAVVALSSSTAVSSEMAVLGVV